MLSGKQAASLCIDCEDNALLRKLSDIHISFFGVLLIIMVEDCLEASVDEADEGESAGINLFSNSKFEHRRFDKSNEQEFELLRRNWSSSKAAGAAVVDGGESKCWCSIDVAGGARRKTSAELRQPMPSFCCFCVFSPSKF